MENIADENKFNVLIIAYYFPPMGLSGVQRTLKFVKYLPDFAWNPVVLTCDSNNSYYAYDESLLKDIPLNVKIYRAAEKKNISKIRKKSKKFPNYLTQKIGRFFLQIFKQPDTKIHWKKFALHKAEEIIRENDIKIIFATAPPFTDFLIAKELSQKFDIPFVVDYRDNWVDNPFHFFPTIWHKNYNIKLEKSILNFAEKAFVTTRFAKELILKRYRFLNYDDIVILPHGFDPQDFQETQINYKENNRIVFTHSGLFQDDRNPKFFLKAMSLFLKENNIPRESIELRFIGLMRPSHLRLFKKYNLKDISLITGYVEHQAAIEYLKTSDVLWLTLNDNIRSPGKLYEYIGARKTILFLGPRGQMSAIVNESNAGFVAESKKVKEIKKKIEEIYKLWQKNSLPIPSEEFVNQYNRKTISSVLARYLSLHSKI